MKLPLRYFILVCLLLGAVGVPWAWREYQGRREAEIRAAEIRDLKSELADLIADRNRVVSSNADTGLWTIRRQKRIEQVCDRLTELTGVRPSLSYRPFDDRRINYW